MKKTKRILVIALIILLALSCGFFAFADEITITPPYDSHLYIVESINDTSVDYVCPQCEDRITVRKSKIILLWDTKYINKTVSNSDIDDSCYLDLNSDGIINAKDYSIINKF